MALKTPALLLLFAMSCSSPDVKNADPGATNNTATNNTATNNTATNGIPANNNTCACVWEGPVEFALSHVSTTPDGLYIGGELTWQPCCAASTNASRNWFVEWDGTSDLSPTPTSAIPVELPAGETDPVVVAAPTGGVEIHVMRSASDSVLSETLDIGDVVSPAGDGVEVTAEVMVDVTE